MNVLKCVKIFINYITLDYNAKITHIQVNEILTLPEKFRTLSPLSIKI